MPSTSRQRDASNVSAGVQFSGTVTSASPAKSIGNEISAVTSQPVSPGASATPLTMQARGQDQLQALAPAEILARLKIPHPKWRARAEYAFRKSRVAQQKRLWFYAALAGNIPAMKFFIKASAYRQLINGAAGRENAVAPANAAAVPGAARRGLAPSFTECTAVMPLQKVNALSHAAQIGAEDVVAFLLSCPELDPNVENPLIRAAANGHSLIVSRLLTHERINVNAFNACGETALEVAVARGDLVIMDMLLAHTGIDAGCGAPLVKAMLGQQKKAVDRLLNLPNIDLNATVGGVSALSCAAGDGDQHLVQRLLGMACIDPNRGYALKNAVSIDNLAIVEMLLNAPGVDVNLRDDVGETVLANAAYCGRERVLNRLLQVPEIDINASHADGHSALSRAAYAGKEGIVRRLLKVEKIDPNLGAPMVWAAINWHWGVVELMLNHPGIDINVRADVPNNSTLLSVAVDRGAIELALRLLRLDTLNPNAGAPLVIAACRGHVGIVRNLLEHPGIDVNGTDSLGRSALLWAATRGDIRILQLLLRAADINVNRENHAGQTPLARAAHFGRTDVVATLLGSPGIDRERGWPLIWAAAEGHVGVMNLLLLHQCDVNVRDSKGNTALITAVMRANSASVRRLLQCAKIQVNAQNMENKTALLQAVRAGNTELVTLLLARRDIDPNAGQPMMVAAAFGHWSMVRQFLELRSVNVNVADAGGKTALCFASVAGNANIVKTLLASLAIDVYLGQPLVLAASEGYLEVVKLLLSHAGGYSSHALEQISSALSVAAAKEHWGIVNCLCEYEASLS